MKQKTLSQVYAEASKKNQPLIVQKSHATSLPWVKLPRPQASFGFVNDWVNVAEIDGGFASLCIPFQPNKLGWVKQETLHLFRFDPKKKSFELVDDVLHHPKYHVIYATIDRPGIYGLIGLHTHPLVQETIRLICEFQPIARTLPEKIRKVLRNRICDLILCSKDMEQLSKSRKDLVELMKNFGQNMSKLPLPPKLPALAGKTICDRCRGVDIAELPECQIIKEPFHNRPCKQAIWESVGPYHISGAIRQILIDPTNRKRLYAVSANGGIWKLNNVDKYPNPEPGRPLTDNFWHPLTDDLPNLRFRTMAVAPSNGRILYAANVVKELWSAGQPIYSEIYRSSNWGGNWQTIHQAGMGVVHKIVVHRANPNVVFAASSTGLWRRAIGAWENLREGNDCLDVALDPEDSSIVYLGIRSKGVFKSFTSGSIWLDNPILDFDPSQAGPDDPTTRGDESRQTIKIAVGRRDKDGKLQTPTKRTVVVRFGNQINVSNKSGDDPNSWKRTLIGSNGLTPPTSTELSKLDGGGSRRSDIKPAKSNEWCNCLAVDPFDPEHILVGSLAIFESRDGGQTWNPYTYPHHEDQHSIVFDEEKRSLAYVAGDGGIFSSTDGGASWPTMSLADTIPAPGRGTNLALGLVTSEFRHSAVRHGRCFAAIDHTGYILGENIGDGLGGRWQFLFDGPDNSAAHSHENSYVFSCPASNDRWYVFNMVAGEDPTNVTGRLVQFDFTHTDDGLANSPQPHPYNTNVFLSNLQSPVFDGPVNLGTWFPEDLIYNGNMPGPFAIRYSEANDERLILFATVDTSGTQFNIQSIRLTANGTSVIARNLEAQNSAAPFWSIVFDPNNPERAFATTKNGLLFQRDFSDSSEMLFQRVSQWPSSLMNTFVSRLIPVRSPDFKLYLLSQNEIGRYDDDRRSIVSVHTWDEPNERLMSLAAHPLRSDTFFLGTSRGVYISEDGCVSWEPYRQAMPAVPITGLSFDRGYLYAATFGRGLWRCRPCPK